MRCRAADDESQSGGRGKTTLTQGLTERLSESGFQFCVIVPEGDYQGLEHAVALGDAEAAPNEEQVIELQRSQMLMWW